MGCRVSTPTLHRRRAESGRLRGLAHLVPERRASRYTDTVAPLDRYALCGFRPKRGWARYPAPDYETTCARCEEARDR